MTESSNAQSKSMRLEISWFGLQSSGFPHMVRVKITIDDEEFIEEEMKCKHPLLPYPITKKECWTRDIRDNSKMTILAQRLRKASGSNKKPEISRVSYSISDIADGSDKQLSFPDDKQYTIRIRCSVEQLERNNRLEDASSESSITGQGETAESLVGVASQRTPDIATVTNAFARDTMVNATASSLLQSPVLTQQPNNQSTGWLVLSKTEYILGLMTALALKYSPAQPRNFYKYLVKLFKKGRIESQGAICNEISQVERDSHTSTSATQATRERSISDAVGCDLHNKVFRIYNKRHGTSISVKQNGRNEPITGFINPEESEETWGLMWRLSKSDKAGQNWYSICPVDCKGKYAGADEKYAVIKTVRTWWILETSKDGYIIKHLNEDLCWSMEEPGDNVPVLLKPYVRSEEANQWQFTLVHDHDSGSSDPREPPRHGVASPFKACAKIFSSRRKRYSV